MIDAQTSVNAAQAALDEYLASAEESKPAASLADIDAELDRVAESIASQTAVRPERMVASRCRVARTQAAT